MVVDGQTLPCYFADGLCKPTTETPFPLVRFKVGFCLFLTLQDFVGRMTRIDERYWIETDSFIHSSRRNKSDTSSEIKGTSYSYIHAPHTKNPQNLAFHVLNFFPHTETILWQTRTSLFYTIFRSFCDIPTSFH